MKKIVKISRWVCVGSIAFWVLTQLVLRYACRSGSISYFLNDMRSYVFFLFVFSGLFYLFGSGYRQKSESKVSPSHPEDRSARNIVLVIVSGFAATGMLFSGIMFVFSPIIPVPDGGDDAKIFRGMVASFALAVFLVSFVTRMVCRHYMAKQRKSSENTGT